MDKATKDTLLKNKDSLSADALEKRKKINKSILKFFFIPAFFLFLIVVVAA
ncbi:MAG: hypothetical protein GY729_04660, partial [Desulfobacteraceae bacterium]|nr:hypothetical protein [Desulfobacteraceae bacterium]